MNDPFINPNWKPKFEKRLLYVVIFATSLGLPGSETKTSSMTQEVNSSVMWSCPPVFGQARDPNVVRWKVMGVPTCMTVSSVHSIFQSCNCRYCHGTKNVSNADLKSHKKGPCECNRGAKQHPNLLPFSPSPPLGQAIMFCLLRNYSWWNSYCSSVAYREKPQKIERDNSRSHLYL